MGSLMSLLREEGYLDIREIPGKGLCALKPFMFTWGLMVGLNRIGYDYRYCYQNLADALRALQKWDGEGDPPGPWIKRKGGGEDVLGPGALKEEF